MNKEIREVQIVKPKPENKYSETEIRDAWNEVGRQHNALTLAWLLEKLRELNGKNCG